MSTIKMTLTPQRRHTTPEETVDHLLGNTPNENPQWVAEPVHQIRQWEVGRAFVGCSDDEHVVALQRIRLGQMLEAYGAEAVNWVMAPEIRSIHNHVAEIGPRDFGRQYGVRTEPCQWAVYGIVLSETAPSDWYVPEGSTIPNEDDETL